ncbi:hypothetical protein [Pseudalkalibacillus salsuginis]|uniref:hypothetical protein n=1 Tax=Pseudalkalibacillus salsuginis TaxID=2910972 RepID=UPI001F36291F|nr:hypothetical protein [Pseudalkalibacillus salsuginis]MCF6410105.1 hypothetical protein [Pseudalkalibacillus salsuginis]
MKEIWKWTAALFLVIGLLAGCGTAEDEQSNENDTEQSGTTDDSSSSDPDSTSESEGTGDEQEAVEQTGEGTYNGLADNHTVEIMLEDGPQAFQITEEVKVQVDELEPDTEVQFNYIDKDGTLTITDIKTK